MGRQRSFTSLWRRNPPDPARMGGAIWLYKRPFRHRILRFLLLQWRRLRLHWSRKPTRRWHASQLDPATSICSADPPASQQFRSHSLPPSGESHASKRANCCCCKCRAVTAVRAGLRCMPMMATASAFPVWGNPMQMPRSLALIVLTARTSVSPLCACGSLSFQRPSPFFPEVHDKLTRSWRSPYSARLRTSASSALTTIDGAEEKGYERMPQLDESVAAHLCPPTAIGWKAKATHPSKPCRTTSALAGRSYASAGQAASALHSMAVLQVYQAKLLSAIDESEPDPATLKGAEKCNRPGSVCHQDHRPGDRKVYGQPGGARAPPVAHADGNQGCRSPSLTPRFPPTASLDLRWKDSLSASQRRRRRHRPCDTSCQSAPAPQLLIVALKPVPT